MSKQWFVKVNDKGMSITGFWRKGLVSLLFSRLIPLVLLMLLHLFLLIFAWIIFGSIISEYLIGGIFLFDVVGVIILVNSERDPTSKLTWMLFISLTSFIGICAYFWFQRKTGLKRIIRNSRIILEEEKKYLPYKECWQEKQTQSIAKYLYISGPFPCFENNEVSYFPLGENKFEALLKELNKAKNFIFIEYFIIEEGEMWGKILEILAKKAQEGLEVRVMYDGTCELSTLPFNYPKRLKKLGIKCRPWNRLKPIVSASYNYRDHRKILVIDGKVAFNGGVNLADEYINQKEVHGHWKDVALMVKGPAVKSYTAMFLQMWNAQEKDIENLDPYLDIKVAKKNAKGLIIPYADSPLDNYKSGEMVYIDILNRAREYVYIMSPYLIIDGQMETALKYAAQRGVEVNLMLPGIPDKKLIWYLAQSHYYSLLEAGVNIYEYEPGFVHAKVFLADDIRAVVGTINLDYRSLYHHYECATYLYDVECLKDIKQDYLATLAKCRKIDETSLQKQSWYRKLLGAILRLLAPLL